MPKKKTGKQITIPKITIPTRFTQQQVLYTLLLVAVFLLGYLFATVQALKKPVSKIIEAPTAQQQPAAQQPAAPDPNKVYNVDAGHLPVNGDKNAKVTVIEFSDFECPFCGKFFTDTYPSLKKDYIDTGKVKFYFRHYPLPFHTKAVPLANLAECANDQGEFWKMHDKIFENNSTVPTLTDADFKQWAVDLGMDATTFNNCYDAKTHQKEIDKDSADGQVSGVSGTPTFYINGKQLVGAQPYASFKPLIDAALAK